MTPGPRAWCQGFRSQLSLNTGRALTAWTGPRITCLLSPFPAGPTGKNTVAAESSEWNFSLTLQSPISLDAHIEAPGSFFNSSLTVSHISALAIPFLSAPWCCCSVRSHVCFYSNELQPLEAFRRGGLTDTPGLTQALPPENSAALRNGLLGPGKSPYFLEAKTHKINSGKVGLRHFPLFRTLISLF